jgi:hypothetical protein
VLVPPSPKFHCQEMGVPVRFKFKPMIPVRGWRQEYAEIIFFENALALTNFKGGNFALAAQVSAVAAASGAAASAKYQQGVAVFTVAIGGLMYEASVGGQKFGFTPFGPWWLAAFVHDHLYRHTWHERSFCDDILNEAMASLGVSDFKRVTIYEAVRNFGGLAFAANRKLLEESERKP